MVVSLYASMVVSLYASMVVRCPGTARYPRRDSNAGHRLRRPVLYPTELRGHVEPLLIRRRTRISIVCQPGGFYHGCAVGASSPGSAREMHG
jgi:hypothetical protein